MTKYVCQFSGGAMSWAAAKRIAERHGTENMALLFADTCYEDEDTYRFLYEAAANVGVPVTRVADGRNPWEVFHDERFLGNSRIDPCSKILKRIICDRWMKENCDPSDTVRVVGIHWSESDRFERLAKRLEGWRVEAPMCEKPFIGAADIHALYEAAGIKKQRLYQMGFSHANCGGGCVKGGQGHWARVLEFLPHKFAEAERGEEWMTARVGQPVAILKEVVGIDADGKPIYALLPLKELRRRIEEKRKVDLFDMGGCGCFTGDLEEAA